MKTDSLKDIIRETRIIFGKRTEQLKQLVTGEQDSKQNEHPVDSQDLITLINLTYSDPDIELTEEKIPSILHKIAGYVGADYVAVTMFSANNSTQHFSKWSSKPLALPEPIAVELQKTLTAELSKGESIYIRFNEPTTEGSDNHFLFMKELEINGLITIPLLYNEHLIGMLEMHFSCSSQDFNPQKTAILPIIAKMQSNLLQRILVHNKQLLKLDQAINRQLKTEKELKKTRKNAEDAQKSKDTFFINLSHEIRTPLNIIDGMHRELSREKLTSEQHQLLQQSNIASRFLLNLFNNVMDINDIETGVFQLNKKDFNLTELVLDVREMLESKINEKKSINFQLIISESLAHSYTGDAQRLQQILVKLISNAYKFTNEGVVRVEVKLRRKTDKFHELYFEVSDTGIGMSKAFMNRIFNQFAQEDESLSRIHQGAGLGLYICYKLSTIMGGNIRVESEQGIGTQFQLTLPLPVSVSQNQDIRPSRNTGYNFSHLRILLVEDNDTNRFIATKTLHFTGCQVTEAANGLEAVELMRKQSFDLVLMDIQMPVMNGMDATLIIRNELNLSTPIIAFTANAIESEIAKYLKCGMEDYIVKPFRENELYQKIELHTSKQTIEKVVPISEKLYDLSYLQELSQGDETFTLQIIETFVSMAEQSIRQLKAALIESDFVAIKKIAHKIKPTLANFQIVTIKSIIDRLNATDQGIENKDILKADVEKVIEVLAKVLEELKEQGFSSK